MLGQKNVFGAFCQLMILPLALYAAALSAHFGLIALPMPAHSVIMLAVLLVFAAFFAPQNEFCQGAKLLKNREIFERALEAEISAKALKIGNCVKANKDFDEFFDEFLCALKPLNFAQVAAGMFPMLGILGTFISIALAMPDFSGPNSVLEREITELLGGIATAFYVSVYGIILSIWWIIAARVGIGKITRFKERAKAASAAQFWSKRELETARTGALLQTINQCERLLKRVSEDEFFTRLSAVQNEKFALLCELLDRYEALNNAQIAMAENAQNGAQKALEDARAQLAAAKSERENLLKEQSEFLREVYKSAGFAGGVGVGGGAGGAGFAGVGGFAGADGGGGGFAGVGGGFADGGVGDGGVDRFGGGFAGGATGANSSGRPSKTEASGGVAGVGDVDHFDAGFVGVDSFGASRTAPRTAAQTAPQPAVQIINSEKVF